MQNVRFMDLILGCPAVYKMRQTKFSVTAFLHNQNLLSHECTHHMYAADFIKALADKEHEFEKGAAMLKRINNMVGNLD